MKILFVRFSSIGDIVLTTPVIRCTKQKLDNVEIHYLTKNSFENIIAPNPAISKVFTIEKSIDEVVEKLKLENYDWIIDLHNNIRTKSLKSKLKRPSKTFKKLNYKKWLLVNLKKDKMPNIHVVDRYFDTVSHLGVKSDAKPCDYFIEKENEVDVSDELGLQKHNYIAIAIGAQFKTKQMPASLLVKIIDQLKEDVVLIGGPTDVDLATDVVAKSKKKIVNTCGKFNLQQSASIVAQSKRIITNDTGMMHIASAFNISISSVWGNTVPSLGMYPYHPGNTKFSIHEVKNLSCRPCSKIGFQKCPKGHFNCMNLQDAEKIATLP